MEDSVLGEAAGDLQVDGLLSSLPVISVIRNQGQEYVKYYLPKYDQQPCPELSLSPKDVNLM